MIIRVNHGLGAMPGFHGTVAYPEAVVAFEPGKEMRRARGLRFEVKQSDPISLEGIAFLDIDEIESLKLALDQMGRTIAEWGGTKRDETEMSFESRGNLRVGFSVDTDGRVTCFLKAGLIPSVTALFEESMVKDLRIKVDAATVYLNSDTYLKPRP